jgi:hypothetical protein
MSKFIDVGGKRFEVGGAYLFNGVVVVAIDIGNETGIKVHSYVNAPSEWFVVNVNDVKEISFAVGTITDTPWEPVKGEWCRFIEGSITVYSIYSDTNDRGEFVDRAGDGWSKCRKLSDELKAALEAESKGEQYD